MIVLDTDHLSFLAEPTSSQRRALIDRMIEAEVNLGEQFFGTIISVEEQLRGWLAQIARNHVVHRQLSAYERLQRVVNFFATIEVLPFDQRAADHCESLRQARIRIGTMDRKIASIALVHDALLLTANILDFGQVPGLRAENWLV